MKKKKYLNFFLVSITIIIISICSFYIYIGHLFGNAAKETVKILYEVKQEWKKKNINHIDSILLQTEKKFDSLNKNIIKGIRFDSIVR